MGPQEDLIVIKHKCLSVCLSHTIHYCKQNKMRGLTLSREARQTANMVYMSGVFHDIIFDKRFVQIKKWMAKGLVLQGSSLSLDLSVYFDFSPLSSFLSPSMSAVTNGSASLPS